MRSILQRPSVAAAGLLVALCAAQSRAQGFDGQRYDPPPTGAGGLIVERPVVPRHLSFSLGLVADYAYEPVVLRDVATGAILERPLVHALTLDVMASIGLGNVFELGLDLPVDAIYQGEAGLGGAVASPGLGDLRAVPKLAFTSRGAVQLAFGVAAPVTFPTGDPGGLRGDGSVTVNPEVLAGLRGSSWGLSASAGFFFRPGGPALSIVGNEVRLGLGGHASLLPRSDLLSVLVEATSAFYLNNASPVANLPVEVFAGLGIRPHPDFTVDVGGAYGATRGLGDPLFRLILGLRYSPNPVTSSKDTDNDGVPDDADRCPRAAEDQDGFEDEDGCPEADNDHDGVPDDRDECPEEPEGKYGDGDGCPEGEAVYVNGQIRLKGKVQFETGSATIKPKSKKLLDQVARLMEEHPDLKRIRIEGHTDEVGPSLSNQQLSEHRAESVRKALISRGVPPGRLSARGRGETQPIAPNKTAAGRAKNRRVEFVLIE
ncbi:MAG TPA: OmpA family protein [Myxococcales bacterium]|jgi:outer membrane protein OmpA-like peptidoglycan-associated protein|nr:OmpA family protein [Myxococcales bacterium]